MPKKVGCDSCSRENVSSRRLSLGGGSGADFCRSCWAKEMKWRKERNKTLVGKAKFPIRKYPG